uniref:Sfi1 spindle body domain-containing protein n=1 Tax=Chaetoceros debilis TaxID=122233 RepID=A0A7S3PVX0_9STRA
MQVQTGRVLVPTLVLPLNLCNITPQSEFISQKPHTRSQKSNESTTNSGDQIKEPRSIYSSNGVIKNASCTPSIQSESITSTFLSVDCNSSLRSNDELILDKDASCIKRDKKKENEMMNARASVESVRFEQKRHSICIALSALSISVDPGPGKTILRRTRVDGLNRGRLTLSKNLRRRSEIHGPITADNLQIEKRKMIHDAVCDWNNRKYFGRAFTAIMRVMEESRCRRATLRYVFNLWGKWYRIRYPRRVPRYDQEKVDLFSSQRLSRPAFVRWHRRARVFAEANRRYQAKYTQLATECLYFWQKESKHRKTIRKHAIHNWIHFKNEVVCKPFQKWHTLVVEKRCHREHLIHSHNILLERRTIQCTFGNWKWLVLYGRPAPASSS